MSLLNEMLRDLRSNKAAATPASAFALTPGKNRFSSFKSAYLIYLIASLLFMAELGYLLIGKDSGAALEDFSMPSAQVISFIPSLSLGSSRQNLVVDFPVHNKAQEASSENASLPIDAKEEEEAGMEVEAMENETAVKNHSVSAQESSENQVYKKFDSMDSKEWYERQMDKALQSIENGDERASIERLTLIISKFPASVEAREALSGIYLAQNNFLDASSIINEGLEFHPRSINLIMMKARLFMQENNGKEALALLQQFNPDIQAEPDYYGLMAAIFESLGRSIEAGSIYQTLVEVDPENGQYWLGFGIALENKNSLKQAISAYKHVMNSQHAKPEIRAFAEHRLHTLQG